MAARHCISYSLWWLPSLTSLSFLVNYRASTASIRSSFISIEQVPLSLATKCHNRFILSYSVLIACGALCFTSFPCHTHSNAHRVTPPQKKTKQDKSRMRHSWDFPATKFWVRVPKGDWLSVIREDSSPFYNQKDRALFGTPCLTCHRGHTMENHLSRQWTA